MSYRIRGLSAEPFQHLFGLDDEALARAGAIRYVADKKPGFPDRVSMQDVEIGERVLLLNHICQPAQTPYRATHAIFVREETGEAYDRVGEIPQAMRARLLSLRAYDSNGMMVDADVIDGDEVEQLIEKLFANPAVAYIHAHNARRGCYSGLIERA